ncbi:MAG: hypothetical protein WC358_05220 [Ignavibacteria bacterium]
MTELLDIVLIKYTGLAGKATEVNSISYKSVDSATYLDSIDSINYPIRAPYGPSPVNRSYESWIKFKLKLHLKYQKYLHGTTMQLPCRGEGCHGVQTYTKIVNPCLWLKFKCYDDFEIKYGFAENFRAPIRSESDIATTNVRNIQYDKFSDEYSVEIPLSSTGEIMLGDLDSFESDYFVSQLSAYKGCEFQNKIMSLKLHYELV